MLAHDLEHDFVQNSDIISISTYCLQTNKMDNLVQKIIFGGILGSSENQ